MAPVRTANKKKTPSRKLRYLLLSVVALLLVGGVLQFTGLIHFFGHDDKAATQNGPTPAQKKQQAEIIAQQKEQAIEHPTTGTTPPPPTDSSISLSAQKSSNGTVTVSTSLGNVADGTCELTVTNGSKVTTQTADVIYQPQSSFCAGFSVPVSSVSTGHWILTLKLTSGSTTASKTITAEIN